jgi:hypothetical protein
MLNHDSSRRRAGRAAAIAGIAVGLAACSDAPVAMEVPDLEAPQYSRLDGRTTEINRQLAALRRATAKFHNFSMAEDAGYSVAITPCWEHKTDGAMGYHYANPEFLFDGGAVNLLEPESLMFEPGPAGQMRLVGMEYIVFIDDWQGATPPELLGQPFHPHSFLPIYKLHVWLWRDNPAGMFADWNPKVSCAHAAETETFD